MDLKKAGRAAGYMVKNAKAARKTRKWAGNPVWLVSERGSDARDNGYFFFEWLVKNHPEIDAWYVCEKGTADFRRVSKVSSHIAAPGSDRHFALMQEAQALISTHAFGYTPDMVIYDHLARAGLFRPKGVQIFLQHGISDKDAPWLYRKNFRPDLFITAAEPERQMVLNTFHQPEDVVAKTGFARYDRLMEGKTALSNPFILVMPTWRDFLQNADDHEFSKSDFFRHWAGFLSDEKVKDAMEKSGWTVKFYLHPEMEKYALMFDNLFKTVEIVKPEEAFLPDLIKNCSAFMTDYSSVYFDVAYQKKPCIFYEFDKKVYTSGHYKGFTVDKGGFGCECHTQEEAAMAVTRLVKGELPAKCPDGFYLFRDQQNCQRIFDAIEKKIGEKNSGRDK